MNNTSSFYQPSPLEEAYANYLLDKVFHIITTQQDAIVIPGRTAVPFFTTSGVERTILRNAWSVADPQGLGKLTSKHQLCVVLRLVALAQAGCIRSSAENLLHVLQQSANTSPPPPLPTFSSIEMPSTPFLMTTYAATTTPLMTAPPPETIVPISVSDAFDSLIDVADAPLPELPTPLAPNEQEDHAAAITTTETMETDEFGDFEGPADTDDDNNDLTTFSQHGDAATPLEQPPVVIAEDDFDDFSEAPPTTKDEDAAAALPVLETAVDKNVSAALGDVPKPTSLDDIGAPPPVVEAEDFDRFVEAPGADDAEAATASPSVELENAAKDELVVDKMSAFDALVGIEQPPPPPLDEGAPAATLVVDDDKDLDGDNTDVDGIVVDVEETAAAELSEQKAPSDAEMEDKDDHDKMSAFDALVDVEPSPLPSMRKMVHPMKSDVSDGFYSAKTDLSSTGGGAFGSSDFDDDDFGDFAGASEQEQPQPDTTDSKEAGTSADDDEFGGFERQQALESSPPLETMNKEATEMVSTDSVSLYAPEAAISNEETTETFKELSSDTEKADANVAMSFPDKEELHAPPPPATADNDDPFSAFDALAPTPPSVIPDIASFSYVSSATAEQGETLTMPATMEKEDAAEACPEETPGDREQPKDETGTEEEEEAGDDDDFGDFEAADAMDDAPEPPQETSLDLLNFSTDVSEAAEEPTSQTVDSSERVTTDRPEWENDYFGDFERPPQETPAAESADKQDGEKVEDAGDGSGGLGTANALPYIPSPEKVTGNSAGDLVNLPMGSPADTEQKAAVQGIVSEADGSESVDDDDFGGFENVDAPPDDSSLSVKVEVMAATQDVPATTDPSISVDLPVEEPMIETEGAALPMNTKTNDSFGDFHAPAASNSDNWGAEMFGASRSNDLADFVTEDISSNVVPEAAEAEADSDADFGDFEGGPQHPPSSEPTEEGFGEWNAFSEATGSRGVSASSSNGSLEEMRDRIQATSYLLPESLRSGKNGPVDFVTTFETNVGVGTSGGGLSFEDQTKMDPEGASQRLERARRCCQLHTLLTSTHTEHASSHWTQAMTVARDELAMSSFLLQDAKGLSSVERRHVSHSLQTMISGLGEYVRVVRSIVATVGDLLGLQTCTLLTKENWPTTWSSIALLELALEAEGLWNEIQKEAHSLGLEKAATLESLFEIRTACASRGASYPLCQLTLQPLASLSEESGTTKSQVTWNDKEFMACAANFWSHKVSTTVP